MSQFYVNSAAGGGGTTIVETLTANVGGPVSPTGNNINVIGNNTNNNGFATWIIGTPGSSTLLSNSYGVAKWVVNPIAGVGTHQTITAAIASATSGDAIFITEGTYTESFSLPAGIDLVALMPDDSFPNVQIIGTITCSDAGTRTIANIELNASSSFFLTVSGSAATVVQINDCYLNMSGNTGINFTSTSPSSAINISYCNGNLGVNTAAIFSKTSAGTILFSYTNINNSAGGSSTNTATAGNVQANYSTFGNPFQTSGTAAFNGINNCSFVLTSGAPALTIGGSGQSSIQNSYFNTFGASCINVGSAATILDSIFASAAAFAISGAGVISFVSNSFIQNDGIQPTIVPLTLVTGLLNNVGTNGQVLVSNGSSSFPTFQTLSGSKVLIQTVTAANVASVIFNTGVSGFNVYELDFYGVTVATNAVEVQIQLSVNGGSSFATTTYNTFNSISTTGGLVQGAGGATNGIWLTPGNMDNSSSAPLSGTCMLYNLGNSSFVKDGLVSSVCNSGGATVLLSSTTQWTTTTVVNAFRVIATAGNILTGTFNLYGISG